ncbi:MAG: hypothetical protein IJB94_01185, partial [Clostridia bacterium]|nr:hypothetical protein [Clostridia bacterium]
RHRRRPDTCVIDGCFASYTSSVSRCSPPSPQGEGFLFYKLLLLCKSQRLEPLAGSIGLLTLVHTTRLTGGYDFFIYR